MTISDTTKYFSYGLLKTLLACGILGWLASCATSSQTAQPSPPEADLSSSVLFRYGSDSVMAEDFVYIYLKNNRDLLDDISTKELQASVREYLDLYVNFKLKVKAAYLAGMDRETAFTNEFSQYREQLAKPYLVENRYKENLIREAYERMRQEVHASHILINVPEGSADTLSYYQKADSLRQLALEGASFSMLAEQHSDDPSAPQNGGSLGYFSALQMVYPFENAAFNTETGGISKPVRTQFGYHIIKVHDKRPSRGSVKVAHIMIRHEEGEATDQTSAAYARASEIYDELQAGGDWNELTERFSEDISTRADGGVLPYFGTGGMLKSFEEAAFALEKKGQISQPVETSYGWHIIKLIDRKGLGPLDELKPSIERKVQRILQLGEMQDDMIDMLRQENQYRANDQHIDRVLLFMEAGPEVAKADVSMGQPDAGMELFSLKDAVFTFKYLAQYLDDKNIELPLEEGKAKEVYREFEENQILNNEESHLAEKYPDFRMLLQEYKEGILLFNIMERRVWNKANQDTEGLNAFYARNKEDYQWRQRARASIFEAREASTIAQIKARLEGKESDQEFMNDIKNEFQQSEVLDLMVYSGVYEQGEQLNQAESVIFEVDWNESRHTLSRADMHYYIIIHDLMKPQVKTLEEIKGLVIADYQRLLDAEWVRELREKYPVSIDESVLNQMIQKIEHESE